jgi:hypothetical protein
MGWFSDFFTVENIAPIIAGSLTGGAGYALLAGAATGGGIAALKGEDIGAGAIKGGIGGMSGQSMGAAFNPATASAAAPISSATSTAGTSGVGGALTQAGYEQGLSFASPSMGGGLTATGFEQGIGSLASQASSQAPSFVGGTQLSPTVSMADSAAYKFGPTAGANQAGLTQAGYEQGLSFAPTPPPSVAPIDRSFMAGVNRYGGGGGGGFNTAKGFGKLGLSAVAPGIIGDLTNPPGFEEFETPDKYKYDPTRQLNLGDDVDSGLRLLATGGYLEGGGVGDGMSDDIPANIDGEQEAALSEGEFVIPADVVSHLGNGSSSAGARRLYDMMATIREARTGSPEQGTEIEAEEIVEEYLPYGGGIRATDIVESQSRSF